MSRWFRVTPDRCLLGLLAVEGVLLLSERLGWFAKGWAVLTAIAAVGVWGLFMLLWYVASLVLRWRFQFSIRSILVLTLAVAIPFSWLAVRMREARRQHVAVAALIDVGAQVGYDSLRVPLMGQAARYPLWLRDLLGDDFCANAEVVYVSDAAQMEYLDGLPKLRDLSLFGHSITNASLEHVKGLIQLWRLTIHQTRVTDVGLSCLREMPHLEWLDLSDIQVTDAAMVGVKEMHHLTYLSLCGTLVTDAGVSQLKEMHHLECLDLSGTRVTDAGLIYLGGLVNLDSLIVDDTRVTDEGVKKLQHALPNCDIVKVAASGAQP